MESSEPTDQPSTNEAEDALRLADQAESAVRRPALPGWFFPVMAALVAVLLLAQLVDTDRRSTVLLVVAVVALLLNRSAQRSSGVLWDTHRLRGQAPFLAVILAVIAGTALAVAATGHDWIWVVGAVVAAAVVLATGVVYGRRVGR